MNYYMINISIISNSSNKFIKKVEIKNETDGEKIQCSRCTFMFPMGNNHCEMCGAPSGFKPPAKWQCPKCGFIRNEAYQHCCTVCHYSPLSDEQK